ncbi:MAG: GIY-YIG nuclease family protein [Parcubacteria group bacterium]|nr:GIY-YIG nuclease family protein [Parcubacteria group bacterium]
MYYTYILFSEKDRKLYIGSTHDLKSRIKRHSNGFVSSTKNRRPLRLIYYESYISLGDAKRRELFLKGGKGHYELRIQLQETFRKVKY